MSRLDRFLMPAAGFCRGSAYTTQPIGAAGAVAAAAFAAAAPAPNPRRPAVLAAGTSRYCRPPT